MITAEFPGSVGFVLVARVWFDGVGGGGTLNVESYDSSGNVLESNDTALPASTSDFEQVTVSIPYGADAAGFKFWLVLDEDTVGEFTYFSWCSFFPI